MYVARMMNAFGFLLLILFKLLTFISAQFVNPPVAKAEAIKVEPPGSVMVEIHWPDGYQSDVDLWVLSPGDTKAVGYSRREGKLFNLLRDDLGKSNDETDYNYENAYSRGIIAGEYIANVHLYSQKNHETSIPVKLVVSVRDPSGQGTQQIAVRDVTLTRNGQELTVLRWTLDHKGRVIPGSLNDVQRPLRSA